MKTLIKLFFIVSFFVNTNFGQNITEKEKKIDSLFALIKKVTPTKKTEIFDSSLKKNKNVQFNQTDLETARKLLYYSYANSSIEFDEKFNAWHHEWKNSGKKGISRPSELKPGIRLNILKKSLAEKYGNDYVYFLETPYFIKAKILEISNTDYTIDKRGLKTAKIDLEIEILDILKGNGFYSIGDTITVSYLPIWFQEKSNSLHFNINEIFAFSLKHWSITGNTENFNLKTQLLLKLNDSYTLFKIENDIVYNEYTSKRHINKTWAEFKRDFNEKYIIKNEEY